MGTFPTFQGQGTVGSNGMTSVDITHDLPAIIWQVRQISAVTQKVGSAAATCALYRNGYLLSPTAIFVPLDVGQGIAAGGLPYIYIGASDKITLKVFGAVAGDTLTLTAEYRSFSADDPVLDGLLA